MIMAAHAVAARWLQIPELMINDRDALKLATALGEVAAQYDLSVSPRTQAWIMLGVTAGAVYVPRGMAVFDRVRAAKAASSTIDEAPTMVDGIVT